MSAPRMPKNAPASIIPSRPMFTTPLRSEKMPPIAAKASGVAKRSMAAVERRPDDDLIEVGDARARGEVAEPDAEHADRDRRPAEPLDAADERPDPERRARTGRGRSATTGSRTFSGGSATQNAAIPSRIASQATARSPRGSLAVRRSSLLRPCRGPPPAALAHAQQVEDQHVGADEEHDEALDHGGQVAGELGPEDLGIEVPRRGAVVERGEEQRREPDADRRVAAEQRDGDADEARSATRSGRRSC